MKNPTITIEQNEDGTEITNIVFDADEKEGLSAGNIIVLMIREFLDDEECCQKMAAKSMERIEQGMKQEFGSCQTNVDKSKIH